MSSEEDDHIYDREDPVLNGSRGRYYQMLIDKNYITDLSTENNNISSYFQMEHSYSRDWRPMEGAHIMTTRTIMVHRPPQCPSCHTHTHDEGVDMNESYNPPIPSYNEDAARIAMGESERIASIVRPGLNQDNENDWEETLNKVTWDRDQDKLFATVSRILDLDHLARLANAGRLHEPVLRRVVIDKSVARLRKALARYLWEPKLTQWLHAVLIDHLPPTYMAAYLDILQTMKSKMPALVDKMMLLRPVSSQPDLLSPVLKPSWEPCVAHKIRKLPGQAIIVIVPSSPVMNAPSARLQRWYTLLSTMANVVPIQVNLNSGHLEKQTIQSATEHMIAISRAKIQEIRNEVANRQIILVGFNAGAALALQVALVESVNSVVCMGFAFNTTGGVRGTPDDRILELATPVMFVLGQNSARSSQEEIESLRERMQAQTSLVVVGSADDALRVGKTKRQIEGVTQSMVDNMIIDEVSEFTATCIINPPAPRDLAQENAANAKIANGPTKSSPLASATKKRKGSGHLEGDAAAVKAKAARLSDHPVRSVKSQAPRKVGRPKNPIPTTPKLNVKSLAQQPSSEALNMAIASILPTSSASTIQDPITGGEIISTFEVLPNMDLKPIPATQSSIIITNKAHIPPPPGNVVQPRSNTMQKIKVMPGNQFVKINPPAINTQQSFSIKASNTKQSPMYTIRPLSTPIIKTTLKTDPSRFNKMFTVKSTPMGTQLVSSPPSAFKPNQVNIVKQSPGSPMMNGKKFTIVKQSPSSQQQQHIIKIHKPPTELSSDNIIDMPIVFADKDGNIQDSNPTTSATNHTTIQLQTQPTTSSMGHPNFGTVVLNTSNITGSISNPLQNRNLIINTVTTKPSANKVVLINRNHKGQQIQIGGAMSNMTMIPANSNLQKFTKVNVSNASSTTLPMRNNIEVRPTTVANFKPGAFTLGNKVEILNNQIVKSTVSPIRTGGFTNLAGNMMSPTTIISGQSSNSAAKYNPIVINVDSDKTTIKNMIKVGEPQMKPANTIVIKPGGLRPMPGILNRNLTVRKVVNLVPQANRSGMTVSLQPQTSQGTQIVLQASQLQPMAQPKDKK